MTNDRFDQILESVNAEMSLTAEEQIERRVDALVREMDEIVALANNPETRDLIEREAIGVGQILFRAELALSFLAARNPGKFRIVR
jgi:hypothetical protein